MKATEINKFETSFAPAVGIEIISNLNSKTATSFDGFYLKTQNREQVKKADKPLSERKIDPDCTEKDTSNQSLISNTSGG